jgi:DivIVA domain-containing protein
VITTIIIVLASAAIVLGTVGAALPAARLARGGTDGQPLTPDKRRKAWQSVLSSGLLVVTALCQLMALLTSSEFWQRAELGAATVLILYTVATWFGAARTEGLLGGAPVATGPGVPPEWPGGPELPAPAAGASARQMAEWVHRKHFSTTRLRPGYDQEEVDDLLDKIRDTFLGAELVPVTPREIGNAHFTRTHLRPGYSEEEVDTFLAAVGTRLA